MKMMKIQILLAVVLLGNAVAMRGSMSRRFVSAGQVSAGRGFDATKFSNKKYSTWGKKNQIEPTATEATTESGWGSGIANWWKSFSSKETKMLTPEELCKTIQHLLKGHKEMFKPNPNRRGYERLTFDEDGLSVAEDKIGQLIEQNENYKKYLMNNPRSFSFSHDLLWKHEIPSMASTMLDEVLYRIFDGDHYDDNSFTPSDNALNYIKLAQYLIDKGVKINPMNEEVYQIIYCEHLMEWYKELYKPQPSTRYGAEYELKKFREIFQELDPLLEQIITDPGLKDKIYQAQQERAEMEVDEQEVRDKLEGEADRNEYLRKKAQYLGISHMRNHSYAGWETTNFYDQLKREPLDESEYQDWLKSDRTNSFFDQLELQQAAKWSKEWSEDENKVE